WAHDAAFPLGRAGSPPRRVVGKSVRLRVRLRCEAESRWNPPDVPVLETVARPRRDSNRPTSTVVTRHVNSRLDLRPCPGACLYRLRSSVIRTRSGMGRSTVSVGPGTTLPAAVRTGRSLLPPIRHGARRRGLHHGDVPYRPPQRRSRARRVPNEAGDPGDL